MALSKAQQIVSQSPVVVFSKSYCRYCKKVKQLLGSLTQNLKVVELDQEGDGADLQKALAEWTGQRTVPNVFINGKHIGGCDDTIALNSKGQLLSLLQEAGAI
ncbi:hypothetical protein O6H91_06G028600 [Diphasiastrum complanatum]|uniref:Uncharacterized protein n=1 Tax=Diphasiastrum complanatum TaxID=34168 RepID=A0ACC2DC12_DIPCM|nr:hypothetical protein O6H91_06G028600 [Diphasiastrum complanatum]